MNKPYLSALPTDSKISSQLNNAYFHDSWSIVLGQPNLNVFGQRTENELIIGDDDKHLYVTLSIYKNEKTQVLTITTIVHIKNWLGRLYMHPVIPAHRKIVPATLQILG